jgi:asparagine synthase (glutamine-hydrolysing)
MALEHGVLCAGQKTDETYEYNHITLLPLDQGIMVGKLFDRNQHKTASFTPDLARTCTNDPRTLNTLFWGRYVGALWNKKTHTITLVRDPQGLSTLFYNSTPDGILFATELALLYEALEHKPSIDIQYFAQHLIHTNQALSATPFENIQELLPGMSLSINARGECRHQLLWDPAVFAGTFITNEHELEEELLKTLRSCTQAWVDDAPGVCVELSGGTDSTGIMLLLHDLLPSHKKLIAINYIDSKTPSSNEVEYAQETADACHAPLYFLDWQTTSLLDPLPSNFLPNRPSTLLLFNNLRKQVHEIAAQNNCPEIMNGQGGDHIFCAPPPKHALADYWLQRGIRGCTAPIQELSGIYRMPWSSLVGNNIKAITGYYKKSRFIERDKTPYLNTAVAQQLKQEEFYLNDILNTMLPGKAGQIESLCHAVAYSERDQSTPNTCLTHPLLSQPIIELGLHIPTYQSFNNGYDRIFFRRAVSRLQKPKSLWRRIKGQTTGSMVKECSRHANEIRDIALNGKLAQSGLIDTRWFDEQMTKMQHSHVENLWPILHLLTGQLWLNQWRL